MKRKVLVATSVVLAVLAISLGWLAWSRSAADGSAELRARVTDTVAGTAPGGSFPADVLLSEPWDALYIFGPYTDPDEVRETLGFAWDRADVTDMSVDDANCLLVFTQNGSVVAYAKVPRSRGDFERATRPSGYAPGTRFTKQPNPSSDTWPHIVAP